MSTHIQPKPNNYNELLHLAQSLSTEDIRDEIVTNIYQTSNAICEKTIAYKAPEKLRQTEKLDKIFTSKVWGFPIMLAMLGVVFYITIAGANVPSTMLANTFNWLEQYITAFFTWIHAPEWLHGILVLGLYRGTAWVVSVMLPPMAIFSPCLPCWKTTGIYPEWLLIWIGSLKGQVPMGNRR